MWHSVKKRILYRGLLYRKYTIRATKVNIGEKTVLDENVAYMKTYLISSFDCILMGVCGPQKLNIFFKYLCVFRFWFLTQSSYFFMYFYFPFLFANFSSPYNDIHPPSLCLDFLPLLVKLLFALLILAPLPYFHIRPPMNKQK